VFDPAKFSEMAAKAGIPVDTLKEKLAAYLPGIVDRMTPNGQMAESQ